MLTKFHIYFWYAGPASKDSKLFLHGKPVEIQTEPIKTLRKAMQKGTGEYKEDGKFIKPRYTDVEAWELTYFIELDLNDLLDFVSENGAVIVRQIANRWMLMIGDETGSFTQR